MIETKQTIRIDSTKILSPIVQKNKKTMPVKMDWDHNTMLQAMGMDWDETSTDIELLDLPAFEFTSDSTDPCFVSSCSNLYTTSIFDPPISPKQQIISHDCMWSGTCGDKSHPIKMKLKENNNNQTVNGSSATNTKQQEQVITQAVNNENSCKLQNTLNSTSKASSCPVNGMQTMQNASVTNNKTQIKVQAGRSLLLSSRNNINSTSATTMTCINNRDVNENNNKSGTNTRPDTPLSLDDDSPEFKHHIDLAGTIAATTMNGQSNRSNSISSTDDSAHIITMLKQHLEDDDVQGQKSEQILEILSSTFGNNSDNRKDNVLDYLQYLSDYEAIDDDDSGDLDSDSDYASSSGGGMGYDYASSSSSSGIKTESGYSTAAHPPYDYQETNFGDHSYTRPKDRFDTCGLGVQTPSDSGKFLILYISLKTNYQSYKFCM